ncbi:MAG: hypothetical protein QW420_07540, partial [Candidatus Caldarchaeum sp.]
YGVAGEGLAGTGPWDSLRRLTTRPDSRWVDGCDPRSPACRSHLRAGQPAGVDCPHTQDSLHRLTVCTGLRDSLTRLAGAGGVQTHG